MIKKTIISISIITSIAMADGNYNYEIEKNEFQKIMKKEMKKNQEKKKYIKKIKFHKHMKKHNNKIKEEKKAYKEERKILKGMALKSKGDYNKNEYGIVTVKTVETWIEDWKNNKPENITGKLIILQAGPTQYLKQGHGYITPNEAEGVYVYDIGVAGACDTHFKRFDGVSDIQGAIINAEMMNFQLNALNIDTNKDMVLLVTTASTDSAMKGLTRVWMTLKYYGSDMTHVSFLNGSASYVMSPKSDYYEILGQMPTMSYPPFGDFDVATNNSNATKIMATTEDMMKDATENIDFHFIVDARGTDEYEGIKPSEATDITCGEDGKSQCYTAYRGHIKTAVDMSYKLFYDSEAIEDINGDGKINSLDASYKFKTKREMRKLFKNAGYKKGQIIDAYCRTGRKANLPLMAATAILGYPAKMYDGSWIQWGQLANNQDKNGTEILSEKNKWRTDIDKYSVVIKYEDPINVQPIEHISFDIDEDTINQGKSVRIDKNGKTTSLQVEEDKEAMK